MVAQKPTPAANELHLTTTSSFDENRRALEQIRAALRRDGHCGADGGAWELVLAEVLNNVVEHAYAGNPDGRIETAVSWSADALEAVIVDRGAAMPGGRLPGSAQTLDQIDPEAQPEGGFGWGLIHTLAQSLHYQRDGDCNRLALRVVFDTG